MRQFFQSLRRKLRRSGKRTFSDEQLLSELQEINKEIQEDGGGFGLFNHQRAVSEVRQIRALLSRTYGLEDESLQQAAAVETAFHVETIRAQAEAENQRQAAQYANYAIDGTILAAQRLAEDALDLEGDVFAAIVSPIELGMNSRVWITGDDEGMVKEVNGRLKAWGAMETICAAWLDIETYSAFYLTHQWKDSVPTPIHWSPKRVSVGPDMGIGMLPFAYLPPSLSDFKKGVEGMVPEEGDVLQTVIDMFQTGTNENWNDWSQIGGKGFPLTGPNFTWSHFFKHKHKRYPYPWLAKAATPIYTRQIIEEMRLALVMGVVDQLWVMTLEEPRPTEIAKLRQIIAANRAERVAFLLWRAGLKVDVYGPEAIEQLLLPEAWWSATLDIFRRLGRTVRIISGEGAQRSGQSGTDAEIDVRIAQRKAEAHRAHVANKVVLDLIKQWGRNGNKSTAMRKAVEEGKISVHLEPIELFLAEALKDMWGSMWDKGITSVRTIQAALGIDTDAETDALKREKEKGYDDLYVARQQFAQRVATPGGEVTRSPEPGRPPGSPDVRAAAEDIDDEVLGAFDQVDEGEDIEEKKRRLAAFVALLTSLVGAHIRKGYNAGYDAAGGYMTPSKEGIQGAIEWEKRYIADFEADLLLAIETGKPLSTFRFRAKQHARETWKRGYMDGVFQAKREDGWMFWQRVLRPWKSKTGPCEVCKEDAKIWHPITEPFWDHPYGVCSMQIVRFMRTNSEGYPPQLSREMVEVPLVED